MQGPGKGKSVEDCGRLAGEVQSLALTAPEASRSPDGFDLVHFLRFGNRRKAHDLPRLLREDVADGILFVQPLHDDDDGTTALVVLPGCRERGRYHSLDRPVIFPRLFVPR
jgi:hypothetical protein